MAGKLKKLSIAFYWHFYQPVYGIKKDSDYIMPWSRLHAVKDYMSMLMLAKKFRNIKININISPTLLDDFEKYSDNNFHDIHSRLSVKDENLLTDEEKKFILSNFFDANFENMILPDKQYLLLAQKFQKNPDINSFSKEEYSDLMALFNLAWINPVHYGKYPELKKLKKKGCNYTLEDRRKIIQIHRDIIKRIIPEMKKMLKSGKIELTTNPYYHPVMPILIDSSDTIQTANDDTPKDIEMKKSAKAQIISSISRFYEVFNTVPKGIWLPELAISLKTVKLLTELGINWIIADESCLVNSAKEILTRDFDANLENPYPLLKTYSYKTSNGDIRILFRDSLFPNLINYEYPSMDTIHSSNDFYDRLKIIQGKIQSSPDETHLLTIALDGENCWEMYKNYGNDFLEKVYKAINNDSTLETVLISEYNSKDKHIKTMNTIKAGTQNSQNFSFWIDEPLKNKAWDYLKKVRDDLEICAKRRSKNANLHNAFREFFIAQASDWFWWYGEPNHSGHDNVFDYMFRTHLKNVYSSLNIEPPEYLDEPIS
ncbi:hypothetical protein J6S88_01790 [bacterium]|nr:hypothetical protein [bacterium]